MYTPIALLRYYVVEGLAVDMLVNTRLGFAGFGVVSGMRAARLALVLVEARKCWCRITVEETETSDW